MLRLLRGILGVAFALFIIGAIAVGGFVGITLAHFARNLPGYQALVDYVPATGSKVYAADGSLMTEFASENRIPVTFDQIPQRVVEAFLAAEDRDFYNHRGVDPLAILRAGVTDVLRLARGQRPIGASTITQQVVRHFLLNNEVSITRKIKEAILADRIERTLSKDRILEIYLNEIYLGAGAYGVAAAAETYFQKPLDQLSLADAAFLAALPKAPNNYNPTRHAAAAKARRDWVLSGMADVGWITQKQAAAAVAEPLGVHLRPPVKPAHVGYFAEEVRRELIDRFGEKPVYEGGLRVYTSYSPTDQEIAETAFRNGLVEYDRRHGWRGPIAHYPSPALAQIALSGMAEPPGPAGWRLAAVTRVEFGGATIVLKAGGRGDIPLAEMRWARHTLNDQRVGRPVHSARDVVQAGDIVLVEPVAAAGPATRRHAAALPLYALRQIPNVSGGLVAMAPKSGRVLALVGGWSYEQSQFDRATQAMRQPGSAFKPFVYVTALEHGFTPSSKVDDVPVSLPQGPGLPDWQPVNYEGSYVGPTTLDDALVHSRNLATVHVAMTIGLPAIARTAREFDILDQMPLYYSMALGAGNTTLLRLTGAYAMLDNGGHWLLPSLIDRVEDRRGDILYQKGVGGCEACFVAAGPHAGTDSSELYRASGRPDPASAPPKAAYAANAVLYKPTMHDPLVDQTADDQIISMMQDVVQRGTGIAVAAVGKPIAGKTGTTSNWFDGWFVGFSPGLVAGVYVGFDDPRTLGRGEAGGHVAAPIFRDFMMAALQGQPATPFPMSPGDAVAAAGEATDPNDADTPQTDQASLNGDTANPDDSSAYRPEDGVGTVPWPRAPDTADDRYPANAPDAGEPAVQDYAQVRRPAATAPWGANDLAPGYPAPPPPRRYGYAYPSYPPSGWSNRPAGGTGGLY